MLNSNLTIRTAVANQSGAMEQRPFEKRVSPKNHMSRGNFLIGSIIVFAFLLSSCATTIPMSKKIVREVGVNSTTEFQYYVSKTITLKLVESNSSSTIKDGQLIRSSKTDREKIVITGSLPGVVRSHYNLSENRGTAVRVAFENYDGNPTLTFGPNSKNDKDLYELLYTDPANDIVTYGDNKYKVSYDNKKHSGQPYLLIKMKKRHSETDKSRRAKGVKLGH